jgi:protein PhnA
MSALPSCPTCRSRYSYGVIVIKDLKVKGSSLVVNGGTKVESIRIVEGDHDIDCRVDGIGAMKLESEFVKKA